MIYRIMWGENFLSKNPFFGNIPSFIKAINFKFITILNGQLNADYNII